MKKKHKAREYTEALLIALLIAFFLRSFVMEAFKVPSASMYPSILIGDHLFVNKFTYGLRIPFTKKWMMRFEGPERGDVVVFAYPVDGKKDYIKRVVGLPGDYITVNRDAITVNGETVSRLPVTASFDDGILSFSGEGIPETMTPLQLHSFPDWHVYDFYLETLGDQPHLIQYDDWSPFDKIEAMVPEGYFFVMGDNRDHSSDSRDWGFVPMENLRGKAMFIWLSLNKKQKTIRWSRFAHWIQ